MIRILRLVVLMVAVLASGACAGSPTSPGQTATAPQPTGSAPGTPNATNLAPGYPGVSSATSPAMGYPGDTRNETPGPSTPLPATPTADPKLGSAVGVIQLKSKPVTDVEMYLAPLIKDSSGQESVIALDLKASPWAPTDSNGHFHIVNVPLGRYGLVLVTVTAQVDLLYPDKHESVILTIEAGKEVDLGTLNYAMLPVPSP